MAHLGMTRVLVNIATHVDHAHKDSREKKLIHQYMLRKNRVQKSQWPPDKFLDSNGYYILL